jgi:hypothetical protein
MKNKSRLRLILLSRSWCHLCDDMRLALEPQIALRDFDLQIVDVDSDPALEQRYGDDIPVLLAGEQELCRHHFDVARVTAFLAQHASASAPPGQIG